MKKPGLLCFTLMLAALCMTRMAFAISVLDHGAKGDGKADDSVAIQQALRAGKGTVELPAGDYKISETLRVPSGSGLIGPGTLRQTADKLMLANEPGETSPTAIRIEGIRLQKDFIENSPVSAMMFQNTSNLRIKGVEITGVSIGYGIHLENCSWFSISDCYIHDHHGSLTSRELPNGGGWNISGLVLSHSHSGQVIGNRIENLTLSDAAITSCGYQSDAMEVGNCRGVSFVNNVIRNVAEGIDLLHCESVTVTGNTFDDCWHYGIKLVHGTRESVVSGNTIKNASLAGITLYFGNIAHGDNYGNAIVGNTIVNTGSRVFPIRDYLSWPKAGIELVNSNLGPDNDIRHNLIANNVIYDNQSTPTCQYGVIERYITFHQDWKTPDVTFEKEPVDTGELFTNVIQGNLIHGMATSSYKTGSKIED